MDELETQIWRILFVIHEANMRAPQTQISMDLDILHPF